MQIEALNVALFLDSKEAATALTQIIFLAGENGKNWAGSLDSSAKWTVQWDKDARFRKKKSRPQVAPALIVRTDYRVDATAAAGCKLMETILVPITSPETINSTRRFC
jgi:hypothetical protein